MFKLGCAFVLGVAVSLAVCWLTIYPAVAREKFEYGRMTGDQQAREAIACKIADALGKDVHGLEPEEFFFNAKSESVMLVTRNGVKTLRFPADCTK